MMNEYTARYQAPCYYPWSSSCTSFEPAGQSSPTDGSNLPSYTLFCLTCHDTAVPDNRTDAPIGTYGLNIIEWAVGTGAAPYDRHGKRVGWVNNMGGTVKAPYTEGNANGYCLSCTDCHEPHGSPNLLLLRTCVNGTCGITVTAGSGTRNWKLYYLCAACHNLTSHALGGGFGPDGNCSQNGACHMHRGFF
jgi:predicted CXXCH cytochrome family protein